MTANVEKSIVTYEVSSELNAGEVLVFTVVRAGSKDKAISSTRAALVNSFEAEEKKNVDKHHYE